MIHRACAPECADLWDWNLAMKVENLNLKSGENWAYDGEMDVLHDLEG